MKRYLFFIFQFIQIPGTDEWYIVYHRRPLNEKDRNHRILCIDRLHFTEDGLIEPVTLTFEGVGKRIIRKVYGVLIFTIYSNLV